MIAVGVYVFTVCVALVVILMVGCCGASGKSAMEEEYRQVIHNKNAEIEELKNEIARINELRGL